MIAEWVLIVLLFNQGIGTAAVSIPFTDEAACNSASAHLAKEMRARLPGVGFTLQCHRTKAPT